MMTRFERLREEAPASPAEGGGALTTPAANTTWRDSLPDDLKGDPSIQSYKDIPSLVKSHIHAQKLIGVDKIPAPKETWGEKEWGDFYQRLGRPESPDKYTRPEFKLPEGFELESSAVDKLYATLHQAGVTDKQAQKIVADYVNHAGEAFSKAELEGKSAVTQRLEAYKTELGEKYEVRLQTARDVLSKFGDEKTLKYLSETGLDNSPEMIELLARAGEGMLEDRRETPGNPGILAGTVTDARVQLDQMMNDRDFTDALYNSGHPRHEWAVETRVTLLKRLDSGKISFT
jgi:hypothetical protein